MLRLKFPLTTNVFNYSKQNSLLSEDCKLYSSLIKKLQNCDAISKTHAMRIFNSLRKDPVGRRILTFRNEEINLLSKLFLQIHNCSPSLSKRAFKKNFDYEGQKADEWDETRGLKHRKKWKKHMPSPQNCYQVILPATVSQHPPNYSPIQQHTKLFAYSILWSEYDIVLGKQGGEVWKFQVFLWWQSLRRNTRNFPDFSDLFTQDYHTTWGMRHTVTFQEKSKGFANQTFRLLLVGRSRSGFSSPDSDTYYTLGLAVETTTESSMAVLAVSCGTGRTPCWTSPSPLQTSSHSLQSAAWQAAAAAPGGSHPRYPTVAPLRSGQ